MEIVGLDFGTTNSIVSFYNPKTSNVESWKMGGVDGERYIPSFLTIEDGDIEIGKMAKESVLQSEDIEAYSNFKILLASENSKILNENGYYQKSPKEIAKLYIQKLISIYKKEQNINKIEKMVISIPEIWIIDNQNARRALKDILEDIKNIDNFDLKSEPICAGAYFLHRYRENHNGSSFNGHFLIFDFGGGTLDITLLHSNQNRIKIFERTGIGDTNQFIGRAGVAYDREVIKNALSRKKSNITDINEQTFKALLLEFERLKISFSSGNNKIKKAIERFNKMDLDKTIFKVEKGGYQLEITPSLLIESFKFLEEEIEKSLKEIAKCFEFYKIDDKDDKKFKIVLVGGFSNFWLSQKAVMDFFGSKTLSDKRFEQDFRQEDLALAISKGASLLAKEIIVEEQIYPISIGIILHSIDKDGQKISKKEIVIKKGDNLIINETFYSRAKIISTGKPELYFNDGRVEQKVTINRDIAKFFPNHKKANNEWRVGFSVDKNNFYYVHFKDKYGEEKVTEFSDIVKEFRETIFID